MKVKLLKTDGQGVFQEVAWHKPEISESEIAVKAIMTGVCRSDIDMMQGNFGPLPLEMQGHEGLGKVVEVGGKVKGVKVGDIVATRGEPAYADYYNVRDGEFVVVPAAEPKYILEPVACGINVVMQAELEIVTRQGVGKKLLILGSGFLAWVAYNTLILKKYQFDIDVVGYSNKELWGDVLKPNFKGSYDVIIDLSNYGYVFTNPILNDNALVIFGVQKEMTTDFSNLLWKACTMIFPSPRNPKFITCMQTAERWVTNGDINVDSFWTKSYNRDREWQQAFEDGVNRPKNYSRGYIEWH
jgi:hypothetical protein